MSCPDTRDKLHKIYEMESNTPVSYEGTVGIIAVSQLHGLLTVSHILPMGLSRFSCFLQASGKNASRTASTKLVMNKDVNMCVSMQGVFPTPVKCF